MIVPIRTTAEIRSMYPFIEEGVAAIKAHAPDMPEIAADVYAAALSRSVTLALITDGDKIHGWTAFYRDQGYDNRAVIVSWMTFIKPGAPSWCLDDLLTWTDGLASESDCDAIRFTTTRPAWGRRLKRYGYRVASINLEKEVGDDGQE